VIQMTVLATAKVGKSFRLTIPKEVRDVLELKLGEELVFYTVRGRKGRICFRKSSS
jgi:AbrB family looped-hinge helix DNA binding protein